MANQSTCYLVKDGIFWRAYQKSAMLFVRDIKSYNITTKYYKNIGSSLVYLGFPDKVLNEIIAVCGSLGLILKTGEGLIEITGFDKADDFDTWKAGFEAKEILVVNESEVIYPAKETNIIDKIRLFPVAGRTPIECQQLIVELQKIINGTL